MQSSHQTQLAEKIKKWKAIRQAVILAHNYQCDEVQAIADYTGDSLELSRLAAKTQAEVIVFAGVHFMAESAKILSPQKTVLLPVLEAGCPMAETITAEDVARARAQHPRAAVVAYVNTTAAVKAHADICCTSANAVKVVNAIPQEEIIFVPDKNLADWVARHTQKKIIPWGGSCCTHNSITVQEVEQARALHPEASLLAHPECRPAVCEQAQAVLSTSQMLRFVKADSAPAYIVGTENGLLYRLRNENPDKQFYPLSEKMICKTMKLTRLEDVALALEHSQHVISVPDDIRQKAYKALEAMLAVG